MKGPHGQRAEAHRPTVTARHGLVCAGHPLAAQAGLWLLQQGGNVVDAALAVAAALTVVEPHMSGIGGDGFLMVYHQASGTVAVVNATGPAPRRATLSAYREGIPLTGVRSVSVPGLVDGWFRLHARYGSQPWTRILAPAIDLAEHGFPVSPKLAAAIAAAPDLARFPASRAVFTRDGRPLQSGEILRQPDLARTFRALAAEGADWFYRGPGARAIVAACEADGGLLGLDDLAAYQALWQEPITTTYRGYTVFEAPPNSSGYVLLQELNLLECFDLTGLDWDHPTAIHLMVEAKRLAFADREAYLADPDWWDVPLRGLLAKEYARERARLIDPERAMATATPGDPWPFEGRPRPATLARRPVVADDREDTTCFVVMDGLGNAVCQLQSLQSAFGSCVVVPGTGILLNNRMTYWHLDPAHPNCLQPGKRVRHTMNPVMVFRDDALILTLGTPGADTQVQTNLQVLCAVLDFGLAPNEAVELPRWRHLQNPTESTVPHTCPDELHLEARFSPAVGEALARRGHTIRWIGPWEGIGSVMLIQRDPATGALFGAADPRRDGYAVGF
jgi:gamma-glutamyltranspeptidase/glutathione hydrolase